jgi:hypothetical protein
MHRKEPPMVTLEETAVAPPSRATRRAGLRPFETYVPPLQPDVDTKALLRAALDTTDHGERKLTCSLLRDQHHLLRWYNVKYGELIGNGKE